jgi:hypothetical protein
MNSSNIALGIITICVVIIFILACVSASHENSSKNDGATILLSIFIFAVVGYTSYYKINSNPAWRELARSTLT